MPKRHVAVGIKRYEVTTYQRSKTVWIASGNYEGQIIVTKGRTESAVLLHWGETANSRAG
jgi:hypothetical protein